MKKFILVLFVFSLPLFTFAQYVPEDISVDISPEFPEPGETVTLTIESFAVDLDRSQISFIVDGTRLKQAVGSKTVQFDAADIGETNRITIVVETAQNGIITREVSISPARVDLLWEALDSYTPPLYKGKALNAHESGILVVAIPSFVNAGGNPINPKSLIYSWSINNKVQGAASGFGKDTLRYAGPSLYRDSFITVEVESPTSDFRANRSIELEAQAPQIIFYEKNPLQGVSVRQALVGDTIDLEKEEMVIRSEPYFFSNISNNEQVKYDWRIDGQEIVTIRNRNEINLRRPEERGGRSTISLEIKHIDKILQFARNSFNILFLDREPSAAANAGETSFFGN